MRQRITYILPEGTGVDPADIKAGKDHLTFAKANNAAVERRITLGLTELPHLVSLVHVATTEPMFTANLDTGNITRLP